MESSTFYTIIVGAILFCVLRGLWYLLFEENTPPHIQHHFNVNRSIGPRYTYESAGPQRNVSYDRDPKSQRKRVVAIDTERVGGGQRGSIDMLARVSLVSQDGRVIIDKYVKPKYKVTDYRTNWSGIHEHDLENAEDFDYIRKLVAIIIHNSILVGHDLKADLEVLELTHPSRDIRDTALYEGFREMIKRNIDREARNKWNMIGADPEEIFLAQAVIYSQSPNPNQKLSLKYLAKMLLRRQIQCGEHDSVEDARTAMNLYRIVAEDWEASL